VIYLKYYNSIIVLIPKLVRVARNVIIGVLIEQVLLPLRICVYTNLNWCGVTDMQDVLQIYSYWPNNGEKENLDGVLHLFKSLEFTI
jgi:hypothetical protein